MIKIYKRLLSAIKAERNESPGTFYQAYLFLETFNFSHEDLLMIEKFVEADVENYLKNSSEWRNRHDILHAIRAQKAFVW